MDRNGFAMAKILRRNNFKVLGFLDNNINLKGSGKFNIRFVPMKGALYKIKTNNNYYIIVCNQRSEQVTDIITQLKKAGISKKRILIKNFTLNLNEKIKLIS